MLGNLLTSTLRVAFSVILIPEAIILDATTLGGMLMGHETSYTVEAVGDLIRNVTNFGKPLED